MTEVNRVEEVTAGRANRRRKVRDLLEREGLAAILLRRSANFAWYTGGADSWVDHSSPFGVADLVITHDAEYVLTNTIEAPRMRDEQTPDDEVVAYPWYEDADPAIRKLAGSGALGADAPVEKRLMLVVFRAGGSGECAIEDVDNRTRQ